MCIYAKSRWEYGGINVDTSMYSYRRRGYLDFYHIVTMR